MPERDGPRRLDVAVVAAGLAPTRSRARDLIRRGFVLLDGKAVRKASAHVAQGSRINLALDAPDYVSRGAEKLAAAMARFGFTVDAGVALDIGASTGGFTEVLLRDGARRIYAVDVGHGQLHASVRADSRVVVLENTDARALDVELVPEPVGAVVADVSFVSVTKVLGPALKLAAPGAWLVVLVKPQFEVGRDLVSKAGVVVGDDARQAAVEEVRCWLDGRAGWRVVGVMESPIPGGDGNREYLLGAVRDAA